jgi:hypothetical protein
MTEVNLELGGDKAVCVVLKYKSIYCHSMYHVFQNQKSLNSVLKKNLYQVKKAEKNIYVNMFFFSNQNFC